MKIKKFYNAALFILVVTSLTGCIDKDSDEVETKNIYVEANATVGSDIFKYNEISVRLYEKGVLERSIKLVDGEFLTASYNNETVNLNAGVGGYSGSWYQSLFSYDGKTNLLTVTLHRKDGTTIPMSVEMVEPIDLYSPVALTDYEEYETVPMRWEVPTFTAHSFDVQAGLGSPSANVSVNKTIPLTDNGFYEFVLGDLADELRKKAEGKKVQIDIVQPCWLTFKLSRYNKVSLESSFADSSYIRASSEKKISDLDVVLSTH